MPRQHKSIFIARYAAIAALICISVPITYAQEPSPDDPNFRAAVNNKLPFTEKMIEQLRNKYEDTEKAKEMPVALAAPVMRSVNMTLSPGGAVPIIQAVLGYPSAIAFVDSTGQPWPIAWHTNSNSAGGESEQCSRGSSSPAAVTATGFDVCVPFRGSNVLQITPVSPQPRGGILVNLEGAPIPLTFMAIAGPSRYDARLDVHVADRGPKAKVSIITRPDTPETGAPYLTAMLDGIPPAGAAPLTVSGVSPDEVRAWRMGGHVYLRTRYTVLSPEWTASESGAGGVTIYSLPDTPSVLLSENGRSVTARLEN